jgi:hypothetical protein
MAVSNLWKKLKIGSNLQTKEVRLMYRLFFAGKAKDLWLTLEIVKRANGNALIVDLK